MIRERSTRTDRLHRARPALALVALLALAAAAAQDREGPGDPLRGKAVLSEFVEPQVAAGLGSSAGRSCLTGLAFAGDADRVFAADLSKAEGLPVWLTEPGAWFAPRVSAAPDGGFLLAWSGGVDGRSDVFVAPFRDGRAGEVVALTEDAAPDSGVDVAVDADGTAWVVWESFREGQLDVFAARRTDGAWVTQQVSSGAGSDVQPALGVDPRGGVWVAWSAFEDGQYRLRLRRLDGEQVDTNRRVTDSRRGEMFPRFVSLPDGLALVWTEFRFMVSGPGLPFRVLRFDRWDRKLYRVAWLEDGELSTPVDVPAGTLEEDPTDEVTAVADPAGGGRLWLGYGVVTKDRDFGVSYRRELRRVDREGPAETVRLFRGRNGPADALALAGSGEHLLAIATAYGGKGARRGAQRLRAEEVPFAELPERSVAQAAWLTEKEAEAGDEPPDEGGEEDSGDEPASDPAFGPSNDVWEVPAEGDPEGFRVMRHAGHAARAVAEHGGESWQAYFGDLHVHSDLSRDARGHEGDPASNYRVLYDLPALDFAGLSDHAHRLVAQEWWTVRKVTELWNRPGWFVTFPGYEWTSREYGHRNVFLAEPADAEAIYSATTAERGRTPDELWKHLGERRATTIPHHPAHSVNNKSGMDWESRNERFQRLVEIFQLRGSYESDTSPLRRDHLPWLEGKSVQHALALGQRLGIIASPDHGGGPGLAGVWATELTREGIFEALDARRTWGTTGRKTSVFFTAAGAPMGSEVDSSGPVPVTAEIHAAAAGSKATLVSDGEDLHQWTLDAADALLEWTDERPPLGTRYYYLRIEAPDGHTAWSSPVWVSAAGD